MAYEVFKGLMQMENARVSRAHTKVEQEVRGAYMKSLTASQNLQSALLSQKLDSGLIEIERQTAATAGSIGKQKLKMLKKRNRRIKEMLNSDDEDERIMAQSALLGINANQKNESIIQALGVENSQMKLQLDTMAFGLRQTKARQDSASEILNLATALSEAGLSKEIFGEEGEQFMKQAVRNAFTAYLGGDLPDASTVPSITPEAPGTLEKVKRLLGIGDEEGPLPVEEDIDSKALEERLRLMRQKR